MAAFQLATTPVTNRQFATFVEATGHLTVAERPLSEAEFPHLPAAERAPGSLVFTPTAGPVDLGDWRQWWRWVPGANWHHPRGTGEEARPDHPVVQVAYGLRYRPAARSPQSEDSATTHLGFRVARDA